jgi:hypothetical protein
MKIPNIIKISAIESNFKGQEEETEHVLTAFVMRNECFDKLQERREEAVNSHFLKDDECIDLDNSPQK